MLDRLADLSERPIRLRPRASGVQRLDSVRLARAAGSQAPWLADVVDRASSTRIRSGGRPQAIGLDGGASAFDIDEERLSRLYNRRGVVVLSTWIRASSVVWEQLRLQIGACQVYSDGRRGGRLQTSILSACNQCVEDLIVVKLYMRSTHVPQQGRTTQPPKEAFER